TVLGTAGIEVLRASSVRRRQEQVEGQGLGTQLVKAVLAHAESLGLRELYLLTTTAAAYFERYGFERVSVQDVPSALSASEEFQGACPASATVMRAARRPPRTA